MALKQIFPFLILLFFFSCSNQSEQTEEKKVLTGPHSKIQLLVDMDEVDTLLYKDGSERKITDFLIRFQSDPLVKETLKRLRKFGKEEIEATKESLDFSIIENTNIIEVNFYGKDKATANLFLLTWYEVLNENLLLQKHSELNRQIEAIDTLLDSLAVTIRNTEEEAHSHSIIELEEEAYYQKYLKLSKQKENKPYYQEYSELSNLKRNLENIRDGLLQRDEQGLDDVMEMLAGTDDFLQQALKDIYKLDKAQQENNCGSQLVENSVCKEIKKKTTENSKNVLIYLDNTIKALDERGEQLQLLINKIPEKNGDKYNLHQVLEVNNKMYQYLIEKKATLLIQKAGIISPIRLIEKPVWVQK